MDLKAQSSIAEFFHGAVAEAMRNQGVATSELTEFYLVNLLAEYTTVTLDDAPLALKLAEAATAPTEARARTLRDIGDQSLYRCGFFAESIAAGMVDLSYYIHVGESAYGQLARMPVRSGMPGEVYRELSGNFPRLVDVLSEVSEGAIAGRDGDVVALYEKYLRTGREWMARKLRARGMIPSGGDAQ